MTDWLFGVFGAFIVLGTVAIVTISSLCAYENKKMIFTKYIVKSMSNARVIGKVLLRLLLIYTFIVESISVIIALLIGCVAVLIKYMFNKNVEFKQVVKSTFYL